MSDCFIPMLSAGLPCATPLVSSCRDLAAAVLGRRLGKAIVWPCQWLNLFGALVSVFIQGGLSFKV